MKYVTGGGVLSYLKDSTGEEEIILCRMDELIRKLVESNINFTRIIFGQQSKTNVQRLNQKMLGIDHRRSFSRGQPTTTTSFHLNNIPFLRYLVAKNQLNR